jgi:hypothetical protein
MNYKLQPFPLFGPPESRLARPTAPARWEAQNFFRTWLVYDSDLEATRTRGHINWNVIMGVLFMTVVSGSGWFCIGLFVRHFLK